MVVVDGEYKRMIDDIEKMMMKEEWVRWNWSKQSSEMSMK